MTQHRDRALKHLASVEAMKLDLDELRTRHVLGDENARRIDRVSAQLRHEMKLSLVYAVLDVGDAFRDWTRLADEPLAAPAELVLLEREEDAEQLSILEQCTEERGCEAQLHARDCPEADPHAWPKGVQA